MSTALLIDSTTEGLRPLGTAPQRSYELVTGAILAAPSLGEAHAALFAEPVESAYGDRIDWYSPLDGRAQTLGTLPEEEAQAARAELARLSDDILAEAKRLEEGGSREEKRLSEALRNAVCHPGEGSVFVLPGAGGRPQPVLAHWGWVRDEAPEVRGALTAVDRSQPVAPTAPPAGAGAGTDAMAATAATAVLAEDPARRGVPAALLWLGWLLLLLILLAIFYLLVAPCALRPAFLPGACPGAETARAAVFAETDVLETRIAMAERELSALDRACQPVVDPAIPLPVAELPPGSRDDSDAARLTEQGATIGELTFSLLWGSSADLDLHVTCPEGGTVSYGNREACGGTLDVDSNAASSRLRSDPVENVFYAAPGPGSYRIRVNLYQPRGAAGAQPFRLRIQDGGRVELVEGSVTPGQPDWVTEFSYGDR
ncbi:hypothetical protein [Mangrovicoccus sp. HB161399]|uniref:hypothetical protein n=1 Tax=Mangrovicoccus sp. HB161399 TaxID=2720392 RepID=UPI001556B4F5|nr:hypothetical protein [Mangrovicoccus sp. HB161399]